MVQLSSMSFYVARWVPQTVSVIAFAVITINALNHEMNRLIEQKLFHNGPSVSDNIR